MKTTPLPLLYKLRPSSALLNRVPPSSVPQTRFGTAFPSEPTAPAAAAGQRHGGGPADGAPPAVADRQPHRGQEERHPAHRQRPQPGGVAAAQGAGSAARSPSSAPASVSKASQQGWLSHGAREEEDSELGSCLEADTRGDGAPGLRFFTHKRGTC